MKTDFDKYVQEKVKKYPFLKEELKKADQAIDVAYQIYDLRQKAGLTQRELAELVGTKQSNIARLESADYTSYTQKTLEKIAKALKARVEIRVVPLDSPKSAQI